ncbi:MAG: methyltransferase family protein [Candidatus Heimdallarchaeaceae archaeon]
MEDNSRIEAHKHHRYEDRNDLSGEHKYGDIGQLIFLALFFVLWGIDSLYLQFSTFLKGYIPIYVSAPIGVFILLLASIFAYKGLQQIFREVRDSPEVIRTGVFKYTRHPIYLSAILLYLGLTIITLSLASLGLLVIIVIFYDFIASHEEKLLMEQFDKEYEQYKKDVPKWIPIPKLGKNR